MTKKIILLFVEGPTDEDTLALIFSKLIKEQNIEFEVMHGDLTASEDITVKYIEVSIQEKVAEYLRKNPFITINDIRKVVQIIDTDGAFVSGAQIVQSSSDQTKYCETHIEARDKNRLMRRNISKRSIVHHLMKLKKLKKTDILQQSIPYEIYYFSRNLEHVLHNVSGSLSDEEKEELAFEFADYYNTHPEEFLEFLYNGEFHVPGDYDETWKFIMDNGNSLKRYCNLSNFFERLGITKK